MAKVFWKNPSTMLNVKPPQWDVFSSPTIKPVRYHSLYEEKENFYSSIEEYDAQVFQPGYLHYCCIMPKSTTNSQNCVKTDLFILFFGETLDSSCIGFRIKVNQDKVFDETNFLAKFLKKAGNSICSKMRNGLIHVKCKTISNAWDLFYCLYDVYLRQYVSTVIGTQSFNSLLYSGSIKKEKLLLEMLCMGSKIVNISKKSIFYKIHKKRKLSVTDILNTYFIMPKFKKLAMGSLRSKKSYCKHRKAYVSATRCHSVIQKKNSVINQETVPNSEVSRNIFWQFGTSNCGQTRSLPSTSKLNQQFQITQKRKFEEVEDDNQQLVSIPSTSKTSEFNENSLKKDSWKTFRDFRSNAIKCYFDIPQVKKIIPSLFENGSEPNGDFVAIFKNCDLQNKNQATKKVTEKSLLVKYAYDMNTGVKSQQQNNLAFTFGTNAPAPKKNEHMSNFSPIKHLKKGPLPGSSNCIQSNYRSPVNYSLKEKDLNASGDIGFTSAKGKGIPISNKAIMAAQNLFKDVLFSNEPQTSKDAITSNASSNRTNQNDFQKDAQVHKKSVGNANYLLPKKSSTQYSKIDCEMKYDLNENFEDISFTTATGKNIAISQKAMLAAQKVFKDVSDEPKDAESVISTKDFCDAVSKPNILKTVSSSSKDLENDEANAAHIDEDLAKIFFEDAMFDDLDPGENMPNVNSNLGHGQSEKTSFPTPKPDAMFDDLDTGENKPNVNSNLGHGQSEKTSFPTPKPRKSLGGRRNIRYLGKL